MPNKKMPKPPTMTGIDINQARDIEKKCAKCGRMLPRAKFYPNKDYKRGFLADRWCKDCANKCKDELSFREYMLENNRAWSRALWHEAESRAYTDGDVVAAIEGTDGEKRERILAERTVQAALKLMNQGRYYKYVDYESADFDVDVKAQMEADKAAIKESAQPNGSVTVYSEKWQGSYTQAEIERMDRDFENIVKVRGIEDLIGEDYCRKFVKQSVIVDQLQERVRNNPTKENDQQYKNAVANLEALSQAAQLAPRYRKADSSIGLGSFGEFVKAMESNNLLTVRPEFPPDQVDGIIENLRHTIQAVQGAGGLWDKDDGKPGTV